LKNNQTTLQEVEKFLTLFEVLPLNSIVSKRATELIYKYAKSHHLNIPDALIAATALDIDCKLLSYNTKDFKYIDNLKLIKP
jgi:predicted nucleic acid-binding protein